MLNSMDDFSAVTQTALWHPAEQLINLPLLRQCLHQDTQFNAMSDLSPCAHPVSRLELNILLNLLSWMVLVHKLDQCTQL